MTPMWAKPRAAPPPRTRATLGSGTTRGAAGGKGSGGGGRTSTLEAWPADLQAERSAREAARERTRVRIPRG